jgi:hypothetical protein
LVSTCYLLEESIVTTLIPYPVEPGIKRNTYNGNRIYRVAETQAPTGSPLRNALGL